MVRFGHTLRSKMVPLEGDVPSPANPPSGCYFHPRCPFAEEICRAEPPALEEIAPDHFVSCHLADKLELAGIAKPPTVDDANNNGSTG